MSLVSNLRLLPVVPVFLVLRLDTTSEPPYPFLDLETVSATRAGALRVATAADAESPLYGDIYPITTVLALRGGHYTTTDTAAS